MRAHDRLPLYRFDSEYQLQSEVLYHTLPAAPAVRYRSCFLASGRQRRVAAGWRIRILRLLSIALVGRGLLLRIAFAQSSAASAPSAEEPELSEVVIDVG